MRQVNLLLKGKAWPTAREVLLRMGYRGLVPDLVSYGSLINVSRWHDAWLLLTCLAGRRLGNLLLQNACLKAMRRSHWQIPLEILGHMRPDVVSFTLCMREQRWREAFRLWHLADPDVLGFNRMAACLQSRWEMAFSRLRTRCDMFLSGVERTFCFVLTFMPCSLCFSTFVRGMAEGHLAQDVPSGPKKGGPSGIPVIS